MILSERYTTLNRALQLMREQIIESTIYVDKNFRKLNTPEDIFNFLKIRTTYKKDPKGVELFQSTKTLFENNYWGIEGCGDCDCFSITALAFLLANGFRDCGIVLVGRNPSTPVHIYVYCVVDENIEYLDLTNNYFNFERPYKFKQLIPFN